MVGRARDGVSAALAALRSGSLADSFAMSLAAGGAAAVGMISWIVAARALTPAELGVATAFVSGFLLIAGCTELNLGVGLLRWLPRAGGASRALLRRAGAAVALSAAAASSVYLLLPDTSVIVDAVVGTGDGSLPRWVGGALFVVAAVLYALFQQQDFVLVGLGHGWWAPVRTLLFALLRLGVLVVAGASLTTTGVVASWVGPAAACVIVVWAWHRRVTARRRAEPRELPERREVLGFLGPTYLGQVATSVLFNQVPLLVTFRYGPEPGAAFFLVWQIVFVVDVIATYFVAALSAAVAREPERAAELSRQTRTRLLALLVPALAVGVLLAEPVLSLFGPAYVADAPVLQILFGGMVLRLLVIHRLGEHQATGSSVRFARLALVNTVLVVGVAALVPTGPNGLVEIALGFVLVQALAAAAVYRPGRGNGGPGAITARARPAMDGQAEIRSGAAGGGHDSMGETTQDAVRGAARLVAGAPDPDAVVSVCVPVYQGGRHLAATLETVLAQDLPGVEVVVLDNASTDATPAILAGIDDPRLVVWRNPATVPMTENFTRVVALSSAPLVKLLPADDLLEPGALARLAGVLRADPSVAVVAGRSHLVDEQGRLLARDRFLRGLVGRHDRDAVVRRVVRHGANPVGGEVATMFRRSAYEACGGYATDGMHADIDLWLRLLEHGDFVGLEETVAGFRIAGTTASAAADRETYREQRAFTAQVAATAGDAVRRRDRAASRVQAPLARRRRELLFALDRLRRNPLSERVPPLVRGVRRP